VTTRIGIVGAAGRMGAEVCRAVAAADDLELVAAVDRHAGGSTLAEVAGVDGPQGDVRISEDLGALTDVGVEVAVEFTGPASVGDNLAWLLEHGIHAVVGATGLREEELDRARELAAAGPANALVAPNFAIGAVLLMRFAAEAAQHLPHVEVIELHHDRKVDAPSGTALRTAELIAAARPQVPDTPAGDDDHPGARGTDHLGVRVHSVRLPGLVAHQEVILGGEGQTLTLRHDSLDRSSFMPGVLLACREVGGLDGLVVGLEHVLAGGPGGR
jgi:4-hydroxy-tetrahydrodipicolinate reductase